MLERALAPQQPNSLERLLMRCPGQCAVCRAWCKRHVCGDCLQRYAQQAPRCWTCAARLPASLTGRREAKCGACLSKPPPLDRTIAALDYAFPWSGLLQHYKFHQAIELRETLLERLNLTLTTARAEAPDWLLPVPLTQARLRERGYNQSYELARTLARHRKLQCDPDLLLRVGHSGQQAKLPLSERAANVRRAFAVNPTRSAELRGRHIVLLDDVMTSGATLYEIAGVLRRAGASNVQAWVVARTPAPSVD